MSNLPVPSANAVTNRPQAVPATVQAPLQGTGIGPIAGAHQAPPPPPARVQLPGIPTPEPMVPHSHLVGLQGQVEELKRRLADAPKPTEVMEARIDAAKKESEYALRRAEMAEALVASLKAELAAERAQRAEWDEARVRAEARAEEAGRQADHNARRCLEAERKLADATAEHARRAANFAALLEAQEAKLTALPAGALAVADPMAGVTIDVAVEPDGSPVASS